ncbi:MAG: chromosomal replication initiator protein DnaA [Desulfonatronovibrio sp. MSAO_Bac4]|nr:MAG: chromosomal replication initiator protein DnaA [Desulfonatronovibrio sp. MSAO_Bac4]
MMNAWERIQPILEKSLKPGIFQLWIKPLKGEYHQDSNRLVLEAPNDFIASWVKDKLEDAVLSSGMEVLGKKPELAITSPDNNCKTSPLKVGRMVNPEEKPALPSRKALKIVSGFKFFFRDFVVGPCNELAYVASKSFCSERISSDQLFLCSSTGLGKTHLAQSMGNHLAEISNTKNIRMAYLTAEEFASQLVMALKSRRMDEFKARFRDQIDVLMLEDIHFFQGKENIQNEFLSTINSLQCQGKKVVLTSTFLPKELKDIDSNIVSRMCRGFLAVIERPDLQTRREIIKNKAASMQIDVPDEVTDFLAGKIQQDIGQLESCLQNLVFKARMLKEKISLELANQVIKHFDVQEHSLSMDDIINQVCKLFDVSLDSISSKSRKKQYVLARNVAFFVARRHTEASLKEIGYKLNRRHSTVIKGITSVEKELSRQSPLGRQLEQTISQIVS